MFVCVCVCCVCVCEREESLEEHVYVCCCVGACVRVRACKHGRV